MRYVLHNKIINTGPWQRGEAVTLPLPPRNPVYVECDCQGMNALRKGNGSATTPNPL